MVLLVLSLAAWGSPCSEGSQVTSHSVVVDLVEELAMVDAARHAQLALVEIDVGEDRDTARSYGISSVPVLI